jgi:ATP-dependent DNA ligase
MVTKGATAVDVKNQANLTSSGLTSKLMAFDLVFLNDKSLLDHKVVKRREWLKDVFTEEKTTLALVPQWECETAEALEAVIMKHYEDREEGVIVKKGNSTYEPGARRSGGWWKWKPEYNDEYVSSIMSCSRSLRVCVIHRRPSWAFATVAFAAVLLILDWMLFGRLRSIFPHLTHVLFLPLG